MTADPLRQGVSRVRVVPAVARGRISNFVRPNTWKGTIEAGPRAGREYAVEVNYDDPDRPLLEGYCTADGGQLFLTSAEPVLSRQTDGVGTRYHRHLLSINAMAVG